MNNNNNNNKKYDFNVCEVSLSSQLKRYNRNMLLIIINIIVFLL